MVQLPMSTSVYAVDVQCIKQHDEKLVDNLLNPDGPQDVLRAIDLIEAIIALREGKAPSHNIDLSSTTDSVRLPGHILENFTLPFITPEFSLSDQIRMLSTYQYPVHYEKHSVSVAKQQLQDSDADVNANEDGMDPLEGHLAFMRMAGGHNSSMNYKQGVEQNG
ncbi:hypothetical protein B0H13DRAFT_2318427 [Mycena leptocephala]|nr:hypothetical protein B0H13DRAFT_2318427 [Mycena leptocephala]